MTDTKTIPKYDKVCSCGEEAVGLAVPYRAINDPTVEAIHWRPMCVTCADNIMSYVVDYDRLKTVRQALDWTLHLSEKTWYPQTDWPAVMYEMWDVGSEA
jgi:hypothetical protein